MIALFKHSVLSLLVLSLFVVLVAAEHDPALRPSAVTTLTLNLEPGWNNVAAPIGYSQYHNPELFVEDYRSPLGHLTRGVLINPVVSNTCGNVLLMRGQSGPTYPLVTMRVDLRGQVRPDGSRAYLPLDLLLAFGGWIYAPRTCSITLQGHPTLLEENYPYSVHASESPKGVFLVEGAWNSFSIPWLNRNSAWGEMRGDCTLVSGPFEWSPRLNRYVRVSVLRPGKAYHAKVRGAPGKELPDQNGVLRQNCNLQEHFEYYTPTALPRAREG